MSVRILWLSFMFGYADGYVNIALHKPAWQYAQFGTEDNRIHASNAVDGLKSDLSAWEGQCAVSANNQNSATWWVNLTSILSIHHITIYYRTDNSKWDRDDGYNTRFLGFYVYISNTTDRNDGILCFHDTNFTKYTIPPTVNITCIVHGKYVIYYNERPQDSQPPNEYSQYAFNELCEVEVYGCPNTGYYGSNCTLPCPDKCSNCHVETGMCQGCKPGYEGLQCKLDCDGGKYGRDCGETCGACLGYEQCHHINGSCLKGCDAGYEGDLCKTGCSVGEFGIHCEENCNENCRTPYKCNRMTGECDGGCRPGWEGRQFKNVCSGNKYGENCTHFCGSCRYSTCHHTNGSCVGECSDGYQGIFCNIECNAGFYGYNCKKECSLFCKTPRDCNHVTGHCNDGCIGGWQGVKCLQVAEKVDNLEWPSRFYGILAAFCVCITINVVLVVYICINRMRAKRRHGKQKCKEDHETKEGKLNLHIISGKTDADDGSKYQEIGELALPSDYDSLR